VALLVRAVFFSHHSIVTYDGTSYLWEAQALAKARFGELPGAFPIGYPAAAALVHLVARDWVLAGRLVSILAAAGSTLLVYRLVIDRAGRLAAIVAAVVLTLNPLFIRLSLQTMSESLYIFLVLLGLLLVIDRRMLAAGLALGTATATRPEGIAILGVVALFHLRSPRRLAQLVVPFVLVFALNVAVLSASQGGLVLLAKSNWLGSGARDWVAAERTIEYELPPSMEDPMAEVRGEPQRGLLAEYVRAMPKELWILARYTWPAVLVLAVWGMWKTGWHVYLAPLATLLLFTFFTKRQEDRYLLPYIPFLIVYAALGAGALRKPALRYTALGALVLCAGGLLVVERAWEDDSDLQSLEQAGRVMRDVVKPGDRVADRKPHMAFYAGGRYVEIPVAPYNDAIAHLAAEGIEWLSLHRSTIHALRPALRPLMYSRAVVNGELRYRQVFFQPAGEMVFEHVRHHDPLEWTQITAAPKADVMAAWSPDGERIAFRRQRDDGTVSLMVASRRNRALEWGEDNVELVELVPLDDVQDPLAWSPDGERIAFARRNTDQRTDLDIYAVDVFSREEEVVVSGSGDDRSPSWPASERLVFAREEGGRSDVWVVDPASRAQEQLTDEGNYAFPVSTPDGGGIAWVSAGRGVGLLEAATGTITRALVPKSIVYAPTWSPDGRTIAVTANDWGSFDIYLLRADATNALLLTKLPTSEAAPAWSPGGEAIALTSSRDGTFSLWLVRGLERYLDRLNATVELNVFTPLSEGNQP
jgi:Tol biopolymer transport system component